jgi:hypothetical protein
VERNAAFVTRDGARYAAISDVDRLEPFLMHLVGNSDVWVFAGSNSPLTAGRVDPDTALFPYITADKLLRHSDSSGVRSIFRVRRESAGRTEAGALATLWEPWLGPRREATRRSLYKRVDSTEIQYEEVHDRLGLRCEWSLTTCGRFGLVRRATLQNLFDEPAEAEYLDGWHQLVPPGIGISLWDRYSYLAAAYVRAEAAPDVPLAVYALNAAITDHPEANESLRSAVAWSVGHANPRVLLTDRAVEAFRAGAPLEAIARESAANPALRGEIGSYFVASATTIPGRASFTWYAVADTRLDAAAIVDLRGRLHDPEVIRRDLEEAVETDRTGLRRRIAAADGIQRTSDETVSVHHFTNVLFNSMRGGTFQDSYSFPSADLRRHVRTHNRRVHERHRAWLEGLPDRLDLTRLRTEASALVDPQLIRLADTYLPITFSRRHGDPSRPWNRFALRVEDEAGEPVLGYEGNWRDIFQNWETIGRSFPAWLDSFIAVFLNASTADGYNPYRVTGNGIDWEVPNPSDPWASIGYWGDHQLVYLARLLEAQEAFYPGVLRSRLADERYSSVLVPYRIAGFEEQLRDPHHTIEFDEKLHADLLAKASDLGADAKLVVGPDGDPLLVSLAEKLLLPILVKMTNFVPEGGLWLNTQRPEWNDANNALAGWGLSMITVCYARRYLALIDRLVEGGPSFRVSKPVATLLEEVTAIFEAAQAQLEEASAFDDASRFRRLRDLGRAGERHRQAVYSAAAGHPVLAVPSVELDESAVHRLARAVLPVLDASIRSARREDGLYDGYDVLEVEGESAHVRRLYPMLEGQVAAMSSGVLSPAESLAVVRTLRSSALYRADQRSYLLYPDLELPSLFERNTLPEPPPTDDPQLFTPDRNGGWHFQADIRNVADVVARLDRLDADRDVRTAVLDLWERTFRHTEFTGRSRTFFMFEGLGSIYWHMIAKLLLAVQETYEAVDADEEPGLAADLAAAYDEVRDGLGFRKTAEAYGAFPTDPYSHTPRHRKAQQPGMTGLVKEEILARWGELGVRPIEGRLRFAPRLLHRAEFIGDPFEFACVDLAGQEVAWSLPASSLAFTFCGTPVCYRLAAAEAGESPITLEMADGRRVELDGDRLSVEQSRAVFGRGSTITRVTVRVPGGRLRP